MNPKDTLINKRSLLETNIAWMLILFLIIQGALTLIFIFPFISLEKKNSHIQRWSKRLLRVLSIQLDIVGETSLPNVPYLLVSNHISWVDIHAINAFKPIRFVAKSEVARWPIFGWMAKQLNTIFIHRNSYRHAGKVVSQLVEVLQSEAICIFPEGTSTNGEVTLPFKSNLFESSLLAKAPICPMVIQYFSRATGAYTTIPAFIGDMTLIESISRIIKNPNLMVRLSFLQPINVSEKNLDRKNLALYAHNAIAKVINN